MKIRFKVPVEYVAIVNEMAQRAEISVDHLAEIALYNIIALYVGENGRPGDDGVTLPSGSIDAVARVVGHDSDSGVS